jgi:enterochelin esterase family protein
MRSRRWEMGLRSLALVPLGVWLSVGCSNGSASRAGAVGRADSGSGGGDPRTATGAGGSGTGAAGTMGRGGAIGSGGGSGGSGERPPDASSSGTTSSGGTSTTPVDGGAGKGAAGAMGGTGGATYPIGDPGTTGDGDLTINPPYATDPDLTDKGNAKGKSFHFTMDSTKSALFKGDDSTLTAANRHPFMRGIDVYVPALYKDGTAAPVLVIQDGPGELGLVKNALDNLTISKDPVRKLPAFVAVAVQNGGSDSKGSERGLEYDTMSDRYARFIQTEVFPAVVTNSQIKAAYPNLSFTDNPEGKAALGCSSGGAAALTMGWFRPDLFRRIVTYSGTFVAQQNDIAPEQAMFPDGAWDYHSELALIANNPRKDLRVFLNANENDLGSTQPESGHHNWVIANQRTAAALQAKGYHHRFVFAKGVGHCDGSVRNKTLADSLVWVWRGYPAP